MAKIGIDFSELAIGANLLNNGWQKGFHASPEVSLTVVDDATADGGRAARMSKTALGSNVRDSVEWVDGGQHQDGTAFFRFKIVADNNPSSFDDHQGPAVRVSGDGSSETALYFYSSQQNDLLNIGWYTNASAGSDTEVPFTWAVDEWINILVTFNQTDTTYKVWTGDRVTGESGAVSVTTTGGPKTTGYLGMTMFRPETEYDIDFVGFADVGETAPRSMADVGGDTTAPVVTIDPLTTTDTTPTVTGTCDDDTATLSLTVDGTTYTPASGFNWSQTLNTLAVGSYTMDITATDGASNVGTDSATLTVEEEGTTYPETAFATGFQDGNNFHPTNSTVTDATTLTPTVNIVPREGPGTFYHQLAKITNVDGKTPTFTMDCSNYVGGSVGSVWRPWYALSDPSLETTEWFRWPTAPTDLGAGIFEFSLPDAFAVTDVWIAFQIGYPVGRSGNFLNWLETNHASLVQDLPSSGTDHIITTMSSFTDELGRTVPSQPMYSYGIRDDSTLPLDGSAKRKIVILGGTHAGEHMGDYTMEGFLRWLVGGSAKANDLLRNFEFLVYPCLNPRGRAGGYRRTPPGEADINRNLDDTPTGTEVVIITDAWDLDIGTRTSSSKIDMMFTWHGSYLTGEESAIHFFYQSNAEAGYASAFEGILDSYQPVRFQGSTTSGVADEYFRLYYDTQHAYTVETAERHDVSGAEEYTLSGENVGKSVDDTWDQYPSHFSYPTNPYLLTSHIENPDLNSILQSANFATTETPVEIWLVDDFDPNKVIFDWQSISDNQLWGQDINALSQVNVTSGVDTTDTATLAWRTPDGTEGTYDATINIVADQSPQGTVTIGTITTGATSASIPFTYDGTDETGFEYSLDGGAWTSTTSPVSLSDLTASTEYLIAIRAVNAEGSGTEASTTFTTDAEAQQAPQGTVTVGAFTVTSNSASASVTYNDTDYDSFEYKLGLGDWITFTPPLSLSGLASDTAYSGQVRVRNTAGTSGSTSFNFTTAVSTGGDPGTGGSFKNYSPKGPARSGRPPRVKW